MSREVENRKHMSSYRHSKQQKNMRNLYIWILTLLLLEYLAFSVPTANNFSRDDFPIHFVFGSSTSAYQVEGAAYEDGRTPSVWDTFAHDHYDGETGEVACDEYHKYKEDVQLMAETGLDAYRFSISWSRLIPSGRGPINPKGLQYYNNLIDELVRHGIQPHVTLYSYDLPQILEDDYGGWLSRNIIQDFTAYADVCFREFGDRVLFWSTVNEANVFALGGYCLGELPPGRCSQPSLSTLANCSSGNSSYEPYLVAHNILLAHASAAKLYRETYEDKQRGFIGITLFVYAFFPLTNTREDMDAAKRAFDFEDGWFLDPLVHGDYPDIMKKNAGSRIPSFTNIESELVKGSFDFLGINYYMNVTVKDNPASLLVEPRNIFADSAALIFGENLTANINFAVVPSALIGVLEKVKELYGNPPIFIHENGQRSSCNSSMEDETRVEYLHGYIGAVLDALRNGSDIRGYMTWSFMDVFELLNGYKSCYGLYYVDRKDPDLKRYPRLSAQWYSRFLKGRSISRVGIDLKNVSAISVSHSPT